MFAALQNIADVRLNERFTTRGPNCGFHPRALAEPRMMPRSKLPAMQIRSGYAILFDSCADFAQKRLNIYSCSKNYACIQTGTPILSIAYTSSISVSVKAIHPAVQSHLSGATTFPPGPRP